MKPSVKRALSIIFAAVLLIAGLSVYSTFIREEYSAIQDLRGKLNAKQQVLELEARAIAQVKNLIVNLNSIENVRGTFSQILPESEEFSSLVSHINSIGQMSGISLRSINSSYLPVAPSPVRRSFAKNIGGIRMDIKFSSPYVLGRDFISALERTKRIMDVKNIKLQSADVSGRDSMDYSVTVDTYFQVK